jgi:YVTN family beta-propeller protein
MVAHRFRRAFALATLVVFGAGATGAVAAPPIVGGTGGQSSYIPTGQYLTPLYVPGSSYQRLSTGLRADGNADADSGMTAIASPDGKTMLVLTSGFNVSFNYENGQPILFPVLDPKTGLAATFTNPTTGKPATGYNQAEWVFVYDISGGVPKRLQQIPIPDTYNGLVWDPNGGRFYVSGGVDDRLLVYKSSASGFVPDAPFIVLGHNSNDTLPIPSYNGGILHGTKAGTAVPALDTGAVVAGFDISKDGKTIITANFEDASASIVDTTTRTVKGDVKFTPPGSLVPQGEFPFWVAVKSNTDGSYAKAYVSSQRDDQVVVMTGTAMSRVIPVPSGPNKMILNKAQNLLYVSCGNDDSVAVIDTTTDRLVDTIPLHHTPFKGSNPNSLTLSPDGTTLYVTLGGENAVAVIDLKTERVRGRIPVGWEPTSLVTSANGDHLFVINEKSNEGPNPGQTYYSWNTPYGISLNKTASNTYTWAGEKSGIVAMPTPSNASLATFTARVNINNGAGLRSNDTLFAFLRSKIKHVIYIVNENRTFDQVLGDLGNGSNGDARLAFFNQPITPNLHALAANFVTLDNFFDSSETSGVGWNWVMQGHTNDFVEKTQPVQYGNSNGLGLTYDWQGIVMNMNLGLPPTGGSSIFTTRITGILDPTGSSTILPGYKDPSASENADNLQANATGGYIWESVLRAGKTVRNYGWQDDLTYYGTGTPFDPALVRNPFTTKTLQSAPSTPTIRPLTDPYYRAFDQRYPDIYRIEEWKRDYAAYVASGNMPTLMTMTIPHDHTGSFGTAIEGLGTPQLEMADHDYAIGELVQTVTHSPFWASTAIVMLEDDPQDGQDHVEAHRSIIHIISPYTKRKTVVNTFYTSVNALRTVEELTGSRPLGLNDANAVGMSDVFTVVPNYTAYDPIIPGSLCAAPVATDLVPGCSNPSLSKSRRVVQLHNSIWWQKMTAGMNFRQPDRIDSQYFNALLQVGITGKGTLPKLRSKIETADRDGD